MHIHLEHRAPRVASRRELLAFAGAATALGAAVVAGGAVVASEALAAPNAAPTPFAVAEAHYRTVAARFNGLRGLSSDDWDREERLYLAAVEAVDAAPAADLREFALSFISACDDGASLPRESTLDRLLTDAKRLTGAA